MNPTTGTHVPTSQGHAVIESRFIHFGCWNNTNDTEGVTIGKLKKVMEHLVAFIENPGEHSKYKPNFVIVAGDNYYPNKETTTGEKEEKIKTKTIYKNKLIEGFKLLPDNIEVNMILGNHDLETNIGKNTSLNVASEIDNAVNIQEGVGECFILKTEIDAVKTSGDKKNINLKTFNVKLINDTLILMIDTSMYTSENDVNAMLPCYKHILPEHVTSDITALRSHQDDLIKSGIANHLQNNNIKNIIIVGHHPIIAIKMKGKKPKDESEKSEKKPKDESVKSEKKPKDESEKNLVVLDDIPFFMETLKMINKTVTDTKKDVKYHYLCADLHLFQSGVITIPGETPETPMVINQYIVGTGGTELDDEIGKENWKFPKNAYKRDKDKVEYNVTDCQREHGFLDCILFKGGDTSFNFIPIKEPASKGTETGATGATGATENKKGGGNKRKSIKRKNKTNRYKKYKNKSIKRKNKSIKRKNKSIKRKTKRYKNKTH